MRRLMVLSIVTAFVFCAGASFAGGIDKSACGYRKSDCGTSKGGAGNTVFQKASKNISTWNNTAPEAKAMSLRGNKYGLKKRRSADNFMLF